MDKIYEYCGEPGGCVPGLPVVITERDAKAEGKMELLQAAVAAGNYRVRDAAPVVAAPAPANKKTMKED